MPATTRPVGDHLREWRQRRRLSQLDLACEAGISTRHLSFVETGRAAPSRDMLLHLAERLTVPLRERNAMLMAAGYAPVFPERRLDDPALDAARGAVNLILKGHEPYPALAVDRHWNMLASNRAVQPLLTGVDPALLGTPPNVLKLALHPGGLAPRMLNYAQMRHHLLDRLRRQIELSADSTLIELLHELEALPPPLEARLSTSSGNEHANVLVPMQLRTETGILSLISTTTVFGTPIDVTLSELALETFFPADAETAGMLRALQESAGN